MGDLPEQFERCLARTPMSGGSSSGRAAIVAFLEAASAELADWSPDRKGAGILQCEIDSNADAVFLGLIRTMSHYEDNGDWKSDTHSNLQMGFERPAEIADAYAAIYVGEKPGTETPAKFLEWLSGHPTAGPVLDSIPREVDAYLDGDVDEE